MEEPRYAHLAQEYDRLFPLDDDALSLVISLAGPPRGQSIVDAGCGTGLLAKELGRRGYRVHGFDLDQALLSRALSPSAAAQVTFAYADLRTFVLPVAFAAPGLMVCLGNTLPHLTSASEVAAFLTRVRNALSPGGRLLLQTLNYDYLERTRRYELPVRDLGDIVFRRNYEPQADGLWAFHTAVEGAWGQSTGRFLLRPWKLAELKEALSLAGFSVDDLWGGFDRRPVGDHLPLVISARSS